MRMQMTSQIDAGGNDPIFLMFHGYGNDESEMVRILDAVYAPTRADAAPAAIAAVPSYISFRATYARPYMGGNYWYPDGCRRGRAPTRMRGGRGCGGFTAGCLGIRPSQEVFLIGFSQGGYLSYRLAKAHPTLFDAAILLSPSFMGEERAAYSTPPTRFFLAYGARTARFRCPTSKRPIRSLNGPGI